MTDPWARWLLERRHGGDEERLRTMMEHLGRTRDRVLESAGIVAEDVVLDVGCGDGLIAFGALERGAARVIFSDVSEELLNVCREIARGDPRCEFVRASVTDLPIADASVDVATTRSVIIYVENKQRAFDELFRVLRPGGRVSSFEPINSFAFPQPADRFIFWDVSAVEDLAAKVKAYYDRVRDIGTMIDFDERDLVRFVERAGFSELHLEYEVRVEPSERVLNWDAFEGSSGNPLAPTLREAIDRALDPGEAARFRSHLRGEEEAGRGVERGAQAWLWAFKR